MGTLEQHAEYEANHKSDFIVGFRTPIGTPWLCEPANKALFPLTGYRLHIETSGGGSGKEKSAGKSAGAGGGDGGGKARRKGSESSRSGSSSDNGAHAAPVPSVVGGGRPTSGKTSRGGAAAGSPSASKRTASPWGDMSSYTSDEDGSLDGGRGNTDGEGATFAAAGAGAAAGRGTAPALLAKGGKQPRKRFFLVPLREVDETATLENWARAIDNHVLKRLNLTLGGTVTMTRKQADAGRPASAKAKGKSAKKGASITFTIEPRFERENALLRRLDEWIERNPTAAVHHRDLDGLETSQLWSLNLPEGLTVRRMMTGGGGAEISILHQEPFRVTSLAALRASVSKLVRYRIMSDEPEHWVKEPLQLQVRLSDRDLVFVKGEGFGKIKENARRQNEPLEDV
jgi:hypothetical protein